MLNIVIPIYNEENSIEELCKEIKQQLKINYRIFLCNDGSTDNSLNIIKKLSNNKNIYVLNLTHKGKTNAIKTAFAYIASFYKNDIVATIDADLQDNPKYLETMYMLVKEGYYDFLVGVRINRDEKILVSRIYNALSSLVFGINLRDANCGLKVFRRKCVINLKLDKGFHRYLPFIAYKNGYKVGEFFVMHRKRKYGKSKYTKKRILNGLICLIKVWRIYR